MGSTAQLMGGDALLTEDYWRLAGDAAEGTLVTFMLDPQRLESARSVAARFIEKGDAPEGHTLYAYAAIQAWVQAAEATGSTDGARIAEWLRAGNRVQTVVGPLSFDAKGDLRDPLFAWFRWSKGRYAEIDPRTLEPPELVATPERSPPCAPSSSRSNASSASPTRLPPHCRCRDRIRNLLHRRRYDLLVKLYLDEKDDVGHFVAEKIQKIPGIRDTYTIITFRAF